MSTGPSNIVPNNTGIYVSTNIPTISSVLAASNITNQTNPVICTQDYVDSKMFSFGSSGIFSWIDMLITKISSTFKISSDFIEICCGKKFEQYQLIVKLFDEEVYRTDLNISYAGRDFPQDQIREIIGEIDKKSFVWKVNLLNI